ncbi:MAG TPA: phage major capsid protein [Candidatus Mediterraneibacter excrementigallinarum]|nr:phage major capsid protein [Candidatus Mediterraneibacter excrementigallinarum]
MKIDGIDKELQQRVRELLDSTEDKAEAIYQAADMIATAKYQKLIDELTEQNARAAADEDYRKSLGLRVLSKEETEFYEKFKDIKQAIAAQQIDILPTSIVDRTLDDVKKNSDVLSLVQFAPADVKKWIVAEHSGQAVWGDLTAAITGELSATFTALNIEQHKLTVYLVIPKAIRDLALPFVDRYFTAILAEAMQDGLVKGYLQGDGKTGPIGIMKQIETFKGDGTADDKTPITTITKFSPKGLAEVRKTLTNEGMRTVSELHLICNPLDEAEYVDPALYGEALTGGYRNTSFMPIVKHVDKNCPQGKGIFTISGVYVMGATSVQMKEYDQTKAMDDADLIIGKCYANGRAVDDNCAIVFDVTKLEEYVLPVTQVTSGE